MKDSFIEKLISSIGWLVLAGLLVAYFFYYAMDFEGDINTIYLDPHLYVHTVFVLVATIIASIMGLSTGANKGLEHEKFTQADKENQEIIEYVSPRARDFREYVKGINDQEKENAIDEFLFNIEKNDIKELTKRELRKLKKLKITRHDITGFTKPLYIEVTKGRKITYDGSYNAKSQTKRTVFTKILLGILASFLTYQMIFSWSNLGHAVVSTLILGATLLMNFGFQFFKPYSRLTIFLPRVVENKKTLYKSFKNYTPIETTIE